MQICSLVWSLYIWQVKTILPVGSVDGDNVDFKFNTNEEEIRKLINTSIEGLKKNLERYNYKTRSIRVVKRNLDIKKYLLPTLDLNNLTRVQTEV